MNFYVLPSQWLVRGQWGALALFTFRRMWLAFPWPYLSVTRSYLWFTWGGIAVFLGRPTCRIPHAIHMLLFDDIYCMTPENKFLPRALTMAECFAA